MLHSTIVFLLWLFFDESNLNVVDLLYYDGYTARSIDLKPRFTRLDVNNIKQNVVSSLSTDLFSFPMTELNIDLQMESECFTALLTLHMYMQTTCVCHIV